MSIIEKSTEDKLIEALIRHETTSRPKTIERIRWIGQYEIHKAIIGKVEAIHLLNEARECYVEGHFIATLMLATALIDHVIAEELIDTNKAKYGDNLNEMIKTSRVENLFPTELLDIADKLREIRNPFAHLKPSTHKHSLGNRYQSSNRHPEEIKEEDAKEAIVAMFAFFRHTLR